MRLGLGDGATENLEYEDDEGESLDGAGGGVDGFFGRRSDCLLTLSSCSPPSQQLVVVCGILGFFLLRNQNDTGFCSFGAFRL